MNDSAHSVLPPSGASRWVNCTGSVEMAKQFPERDGDAGLEGVAAHWVMDLLITRTCPKVGTLAPNGIAVTDEMIEAAEMVAALIPEGCNTHVVECPISIPSIHPDCFGTLDLRWIQDDCINVVDLKFGFGFVDEYMNWQGIAYIAGLLDAHPQFKEQPDMKFAFTIVQPRCYTAAPVRTWRGTVSLILGMVEVLRLAAAEALSPKSRLVVGSWCNYCPAIHACPAAQKATMTALDLSERTAPSPLTPDALGLTLRRIDSAIKTLKATQDGLTEEALALIRAGTPVRGFGIGNGRGKTEWSAPMDDVLALGEMLGVELSKTSLITPIQSKALLKKKGLDESVISAYSTSVAGALKLVQSDENVTRRIFGGDSK